VRHMNSGSKTGFLQCSREILGPPDYLVWTN
jgi:hypothetical protein